MSSSVVRTFKAMPTLLRIGMAEAIAYRAEMLVWVFATTMPLIMLVLWSSVSQAAPIVGNSGGEYDGARFTAYFFAVFIVRQLISCWASWEINFEVRQGTLAMRLLRPMHPMISYAAGNIAAMPIRSLVTLPIVFAIFFSGVQGTFPKDAKTWALWFVSLALGWLLTFFINITIGALSFFMESSIKLMDAWLAAFFVFSGYLFPLDLFPAWLLAAAKWLPFRYQLGVPVEVMIGAHPFEEAVQLVLRQGAWAGVMCAISLLVWRAGIRRFESFGS